MAASDSFQLFGTSHLAALVVVTVIVVTLGAWARLGKTHLLAASERALGSVLLVMPVLTAVSVTITGFDPQIALPLHYCDVATIAGGIALLKKKPLAVEIVYFFGLAGTLQGLLTPALQADFPAPRYFHFFTIHGGVVIAALHLVWIRGFHPRRWSIGRMIGASAVYSAVAAAANWSLNTNFGFQCAKPPNASLMDHLGDWPWYNVSLFALATVFYTLLDLPFWKERSRGPNMNGET